MSEMQGAGKFDGHSVKKQLDVRDLQSHLELAQDLCQKCQDTSHTPGVRKLLKKCQAELRFLKGLASKDQKQQETHLRSSNLAHLHGIVDALHTLPNVLEVLRPFPTPSLQHPLVVDLICNHGYTWVKVIARKAQALHLVWAGSGQFGERSVVDQAEMYVQIAKEHPHNYKVPQVLFVCVAGLTPPLLHALKQAGVDVQATVQEVDPDTEVKVQQVKAMLASSEDDSDEESPLGGSLQEVVEGKEGTFIGGEDGGHNVSEKEKIINKNEVSEDNIVSKVGESKSICSEVQENNKCSLDREINSDFASLSFQNCDNSGDTVPPSEKTTQTPMSDILADEPVISKVNLDITTLISLVSNLCHGSADWEFEEPILSQQAEQERSEPLLPKLEAFLQGKKLYVCDTALEDFQTILRTVGGPAESQRAHTLLKKVTIVPDQPTSPTMALSSSAKVKDRAKVIFGTGASLQAITVSANVGFVRAAANQGVNFAVFLHESRALTEQKEKTAKLLTALS